MDSFVAALNSPAFVFGSVSASWAELCGAVLGVWMVVCNWRVNPLAWPLAIASSLLYWLVFWEAKLYGDASLQVFFAVVALWGWWQWLRGTQADGQALRVRSLAGHQRWFALLSLAALWPAVGWFLDHHTDTDVPYWDAFPTAGSLLGQYLLGRKYVENWPTWVAVNVIGVGLFAYKGLWLTVGLYAVFTAMALAGWRTWARLAIEQRA